jgi:lanthanide-dependent methanol dehydrogenase
LPLSYCSACARHHAAATWSFSTGVLHGHEAAPLVVGDTMYVVTPFPNILYALDLNPPAGRLKWKYEPAPMRAARAWPAATW